MIAAVASPATILPATALPGQPSPSAAGKSAALPDAAFKALVAEAAGKVGADADAGAVVTTGPAGVVPQDAALMLRGVAASQNVPLPASVATPAQVISSPADVSPPSSPVTVPVPLPGTAMPATPLALAIDPAPLAGRPAVLPARAALEKPAPIIGRAIRTPDSDIPEPAAEPAGEDTADAAQDPKAKQAPADDLAGLHAVIAAIAGSTLPPAPTPATARVAGKAAASPTATPATAAIPMPDGAVPAREPAVSAPPQALAASLASSVVATAPGVPGKVTAPVRAGKADRKSEEASASVAGAPDAATKFETAQQAAAAVIGATADTTPVAAAGTVSATASAAPLAEAAITHHLDLAKDSAWLDRLAHDIARSADTSSQLRFSLSPEHLGRLDVALAQTGDGTSIRLTTETSEAHRIVADAQPRLVAEARAQGLRVSDTSVDLGGSGSSPGSNSGQAGGQAQAFGNQSGSGGGSQQRSFTRAQPSVPAPARGAVAKSGNQDELYA